jgi:hypothetical protein
LREVYWINNSTDSELPYLLDGGKYKNLNFFEFDVTEEDKKELTDKVLECSKLLVERN